MSNSDAKKIYKDADIVIDQLLIGFYGGLSVEVWHWANLLFAIYENLTLNFYQKTWFRTSYYKCKPCFTV